MQFTTTWNIKNKKKPTVVNKAKIQIECNSQQAFCR